MSFELFDKQEEFGLAAAKGDLDTVKRLAADPDVHPDGNFGEALRWACSNGHVHVVEFLLADPRIYAASPNNLTGAVCYGHKDVVALLLKDSRIDPANKAKQYIRIAVEEGHDDVLRCLLRDPRMHQDTDNICLLVESAWRRRRHAVFARSLLALRLKH
jgi:ankyrin repeat protein